MLPDPPVVVPVEPVTAHQFAVAVNVPAEDDVVSTTPTNAPAEA